MGRWLDARRFKGLRQPARTFLLYGPPGTGKVRAGGPQQQAGTRCLCVQPARAAALCRARLLVLLPIQTLLVEKVAAEAGFTLLAVSPSMILSKWAGDSEKAVSQVFDLARTMQPAILFLVRQQQQWLQQQLLLMHASPQLLTPLLCLRRPQDEVDSLGQSRGDAADTSSRRLLTELLIQLNRIADDEGVYIFAATNRMQVCGCMHARKVPRKLCPAHSTCTAEPADAQCAPAVAAPTDAPLLPPCAAPTRPGLRPRAAAALQPAHLRAAAGRAAAARLLGGGAGAAGDGC